MNVIKKNKELNQLKRGLKFKNYFNKNKYFFNELYKNKTLPKDEIISIVNQILDYEGDDEKDQRIKSIAEEFVKDHHELFSCENRDENHDENRDENHDENRDENHVKNHDENRDENHVKNHDENRDVSEKLEEIKQDVKEIELSKDHPDKMHIEEFNSKIEKLKDDIDKKFGDMIDSHLELKRSIDEKRHINDRDAVSRLSNLEDKLEMLYGKQMESETKPKSILKNSSNSKSDMMNRYISFKLNN